MAPPLPNSAHGDQLIICETSRYGAVFERLSYLTRLRRTGCLGRRDSNLCISKSDLLNFIPPEQDLGVDRAP
jgi:hypothetical protein